jgi:hypothetical protein
LICSKSALALLRLCFARNESAFSACSSVSWKGLSLLKVAHRLSSFGRSDPFSDGVSRQPGTLGYLVQRELVAEVHPPDFSQHFHADHPVFSCSESEQKQLNTWVSFQSAEQPLLGQFSVSGNIYHLKPKTKP